MTSMNYLLERHFAKVEENLKPDSLVVDGLDAMLNLMRTFYYYLEGKKPMDKLINKVKKDVVKNDKEKAKKDIAVLLKADKKQDKKIVSCAKKKPVKKAR